MDQPAKHLKPCAFALCPLHGLRQLTHVLLICKLILSVLQLPQLVDEAALVGQAKEIIGELLPAERILRAHRLEPSLLPLRVEGSVRQPALDGTRLLGEPAERATLGDSGSRVLRGELLTVWERLSSLLLRCQGGSQIAKLIGVIDIGTSRLLEQWLELTNRVLRYLLALVIEGLLSRTGIGEVPLDRTFALVLAI